MSQAGFSITRGAAKWATVGTLGIAAAAAVCWALLTRGPSPAAVGAAQPQPVLAPPPVLVARPQPGGGVVADPVAPQPGAAEPPVSAVIPVEAGAPAGTTSVLAPEPRVVDRSPHGPFIEDDVVPPSVPAPNEVAPRGESPEKPEDVVRVPDPNAPRAAALVEPRKINVNTAPKAELELLPGIGPSLADRIIEARAKKRFAGLDDLDKVRGIGPKLLEKIRNRVVFQDEPARKGK